MRYRKGFQEGVGWDTHHKDGLVSPSPLSHPCTHPCTPPCPLQPITLLPLAADRAGRNAPRKTNSILKGLFLQSRLAPPLGQPRVCLNGLCLFICLLILLNISHDTTINIVIQGNSFGTKHTETVHSKSTFLCSSVYLFLLDAPACPKLGGRRI